MALSHLKPFTFSEVFQLKRKERHYIIGGYTAKQLKSGDLKAEALALQREPLITGSLPSL